MSAEQLIADAIALPLAERVSLAQSLWESIDAGLPDTNEAAVGREDVCLLFTKSEVDYHDNEEELSSLQLLLSSA